MEKRSFVMKLAIRFAVLFFLFPALLCLSADLESGTALFDYVGGDTPIVTNAWLNVSNSTHSLIEKIVAENVPTNIEIDTSSFVTKNYIQSGIVYNDEDGAPLDTYDNGSFNWNFGTYDDMYQPEMIDRVNIELSTNGIVITGYTPKNGNPLNYISFYCNNGDRTYLGDEISSLDDKINSVSNIAVDAKNGIVTKRNIDDLYYDHPVYENFSDFERNVYIYTTDGFSQPLWYCKNRNYTIAYVGSGIWRRNGSVECEATEDALSLNFNGFICTRPKVFVNNGATRLATMLDIPKGITNGVNQDSSFSLSFPRFPYHATSFSASGINKTGGPFATRDIDKFNWITYGTGADTKYLGFTIEEMINNVVTNISASTIGALPISGGNLEGNLSIGDPNFISFNAESGAAHIESIESEYAHISSDLSVGVDLSVGDNIFVGGVNVMTELESKADASAVNDVRNTVNQWTTYWDGDDVRVTVTNYYGSMALPSLYLEQRMPADETHDNVWFKVVWNEMTRWNQFLSEYQSLSNEVSQKADRAWGYYDSSTGEYSPDGYLQVSTPNIIVANGLSYQKTVSTGGFSMWVLTATQPMTISGETEQGFFKISDGDGNALFEIVKGDKRVVGATATAVSVNDGAMRITYNVTGEHPTISLCSNLGGEWQTGDEITMATVVWSGSSGEWIATVTPSGPYTSMFAKASYEAGGNTYIKNHVASSLDKVVVGGIEYTVTVETINGKKMLVLQ